MVGHHPNDPLIERARDSGAKVIPVIPQENLVPYYSAADVYVVAIFKESVLYSGSIGDIGGMAPVESLACNTPIVSPGLLFFPQDNGENVGKVPQSPVDVAPCIAEILENPEPYRNCREIARRYYDWKIVVNHLTTIYDELFSKYYK